MVLTPDTNRRMDKHKLSAGADDLAPVSRKDYLHLYEWQHLLSFVCARNRLYVPYSPAFYILNKPVFGIYPIINLNII
jgi:hypothetical protein